MTAEIQCFIVYAYRPGYNEFRVEGIFSKREDAVALSETLDQLDDVMSAPIDGPVSMPVILDILVRERLQALADPILTLFDIHEQRKQKDAAL